MLYHSLIKSQYILILNLSLFAAGYPLGRYLENRFVGRHGDPEEQVGEQEHGGDHLNGSEGGGGGGGAGAAADAANQNQNA